ncbi:hypothetical protein B0T26DRAFT_868790 [Lasiosphaeria miniovina]|uniref:Cyanovirin-N domain-containing protein n=1 Tax=Lasiosphaeria miniovina TaxID=1954250 RepID=A0AA40B4M2_9PEZI|nr:uncharacterized protein B0T26DRAFT_868790 [Lasiosphaeria miniovina]KAK0727509.1 hypothetical protein B0T26DRAFT_868790 [Lasiosphaeria miniovina]
MELKKILEFLSVALTTPPPLILDFRRDTNITQPSQIRAYTDKFYGQVGSAFNLAAACGNSTSAATGVANLTCTYLDLSPCYSNNLGVLEPLWPNATWHGNFTETCKNCWLLTKSNGALMGCDCLNVSASGSVEFVRAQVNLNDHIWNDSHGILACGDWFGKPWPRCEAIGTCIEPFC